MSDYLDDLAEAAADFADDVWPGAGAAIREGHRLIRGRERDDAIGYDDDHNYALRNVVG